LNNKLFELAHFADTGVLYLLVLLAVISILIIIKKAVQFQANQKTMKQLNNCIDEMIQKRWNGEWPRSISESDLGTLIQQSTPYLISDHKTGFDESYEVLKKRYVHKYEASLAFLATVGSNGPYIGLFGTVLGIMKAFNDMSQANGGGTNSVMSGISGALIATAAGLLVAIPSVLAFNFFQKKVKKLSSILDDLKELLKVQKNIVLNKEA